MVVKKTMIHSLHILNNATVKRLSVRSSILRQENDFCMLQLTAYLDRSIGMHSGIVHKEKDLPLRILGSNLFIEASPQRERLSSTLSFDQQNGLASFLCWLL